MNLSLVIAKILYCNILSNAKAENTVYWEQAVKFKVMVEHYTCLVGVFMNLNYQRDLHLSTAVDYRKLIHYVLIQDYTLW